MDEQSFKLRTKQLALRIVKMVQALPKGDAERVLGKQVLRSGTSVAANYRSACRAKSKADLIAKLHIVEEETDETLFWLELLVEADLVPRQKFQPLMQETEEILAMTVASIRTLQANKGTSAHRRS
ncbi:MAG: four helix bundle protein [FCB group bacterium]|nr:four helix bundle protein [FCB group bacterium]